MNAPLALLLAYAIGCLSFATLVARARGVNIREHGSGNPGATNVGRVLGKGWGSLVLLLDIAKGLLPALLMRAPAAGLGLDGLPHEVVDTDGRTLIMAAAVLGHIAPVTQGFRGGKGVATLIGGAFGLNPLLGLIGVAAHLIVKKALGYVSVASVVLAWSVAIGRWAQDLMAETPAGGSLVLALLATLITLRHRSNFARIRAGTEDRYDDPDDVALRHSPEDGNPGKAG
ncbi:MAG: glycerol-3-phosphate acyltransferase [Planctomycetota bacterium]|nr:MAG: glycerol-3-phosphate acyltransferase [Planctomycetota bacterium]